MYKAFSPSLEAKRRRSSTFCSMLDCFFIQIEQLLCRCEEEEVELCADCAMLYFVILRETVLRE
jgi:hypothetical protein